MPIDGYINGGMVVGNISIDFCHSVTCEHYLLNPLQTLP